MTIGRGLAVVAALGFAFGSIPAVAQTRAPVSTMTSRAGWVVTPTPHKFATLVQRLEDAVKSNKMGLVNFASASDGASAQGFAIPGNRVVGVFRNDYARRLLSASVAAGIEAPLRFYITENGDGSATLSWKTPEAVFNPYLNDAGAELRKIAEELTPIFANIASEAAKP